MKPTCSIDPVELMNGETHSSDIETHSTDIRVNENAHIHRHGYWIFTKKNRNKIHLCHGKV